MSKHDADVILHDDAEPARPPDPAPATGDALTGDLLRARRPPASGPPTRLARATTGACATRAPSSTSTSPASARRSTCRSRLRGTPFQSRSGARCCAIPFGATASYGEIARAIGRPGASRAVGGANGRNPIPIIVPCHRVIGSDGSLTGYGGGEPTKRRLLALEGVSTPEQLALA